MTLRIAACFFSPLQDVLEIIESRLLKYTLLQLSSEQPANVNLFGLVSQTAEEDSNRVLSLENDSNSIEDMQHETLFSLACAAMTNVCFHKFIRLMIILYILTSIDHQIIINLFCFEMIINRN